jgi:DNA-binding NtrC family response regulator
MTTSRSHTAELAKLLNTAPQPIYVLDDDLTLVFINGACQAWLEADNSLLGHRCAYHSQPTPDVANATVAGLCPPPEVLSGKTVVANVARRAADGRLIERRGRFLPIGVEPENLLGILVILDTADQPPRPLDDEAIATSQEAGPIALHDQIRRFRQEAASRYRADRLIGLGPAMRLARRQVQLAATSPTSVLLVGPSGSGRQHLAAAIHYGANPPSTTPPSSGVFVPFDCSLLGPDLLEAVHTTLEQTRLLHESTSPGTLLLHRVDEVSADLQVELAGFFVRRPTPWRLIATAAEPLVELAQRGQFRDDLAATLSTLVIELPPLARRREDLPLLAQLFLEDLNAVERRQLGGFSAAALDLLSHYSWPGNLDELAKTVAEVYRHAMGHEIDVADLPERIRLADQAAAHPRRHEETIVLDEYLGRVERELIRRALARAKGNKARAARLLGMTRPRLYRRMMQLGLE